MAGVVFRMMCRASEDLEMNADQATINRYLPFCSRGFSKVDTAAWNNGAAFCCPQQSQGCGHVPKRALLRWPWSADKVVTSLVDDFPLKWCIEALLCGPGLVLRAIVFISMNHLHEHYQWCRRWKNSRQMSFIVFQGLKILCLVVWKYCVQKFSYVQRASTLEQTELCTSLNDVQRMHLFVVASYCTVPKGSSRRVSYSTVFHEEGPPMKSSETEGHASVKFTALML